MKSGLCLLGQVGTKFGKTLSQRPRQPSPIWELPAQKGEASRKLSPSRLFDHYLVRLVEFLKIDIDPLLGADLDLDPGIIRADG